MYVQANTEWWHLPCRLNDFYKSIEKRLCGVSSRAQVVTGVLLVSTAVLPVLSVPQYRASTHQYLRVRPQYLTARCAMWYLIAVPVPHKTPALNYRMRVVPQITMCPKYCHLVLLY